MVREGGFNDSSECVNRCRPMYSNIKFGFKINFSNIRHNSMKNIHHTQYIKYYNDFY